MTALYYVIAAFATYYCALVVTANDGPFGLFDRLRKRWDAGYRGKGIRCLVCVSAYTGLVWALLLGWRFDIDPWLWPVLWFGLAGMSVLLHKWWNTGK